MTKSLDSVEFANEIIISFIKESKTNRDIVKEMTKELYKISFKDKNFVCEVLDILFSQRKKIPVQFYEEKIKGVPQPLRLYNPPGVLGIVPFTRNLTKTTLKYIEKGATDVLDVGCGIGLTSIVAACRGVHIVALDINLLAVMTTRLNAIWNNVLDKIEIVHADFAVYKTNKKFGLIVSNPPVDPAPKNLQVKSKEIYQKLIKGTKDYDSGAFTINYITDKKGVSLFEKILEKAHQLLKTKGKIIIASGNMINNKYKYFIDIAQQYGYVLVKVVWFANKYNEFPTATGYGSGSHFTEEVIKKAVIESIEVYRDKQMTKRITDPKKIKRNNYIFKGFSVVFGK